MRPEWFDWQNIAFRYEKQSNGNSDIMQKINAILFRFFLAAWLDEHMVVIRCQSPDTMRIWRGEW